MVASLPPIATCADIEALTALMPLPADPVVRARIAALTQRFDQIAPRRPLMFADAHSDPYPALAALQPEVAAVGCPPLEAELALRLGRLGEPDQAELHLGEALQAAARAHDDRIAAEAWRVLLWVKGVVRHQRGEAAVIRIAAEAASVRAGRKLGDDRELLDVLSEVASDGGDYAAARELSAQALAAAERNLPADHPTIGSYLNDLAVAERELGNYAAALALQRRSLALHVRVAGADHPMALHDQSLVVTLLNAMGRSDEALPLAQDVRARALRLLGAAHLWTAEAMGVLGDTLRALHRPAEALVELEAARDTYVHAIGVDRPETLAIRTAIAGALAELGRRDGARTEYRAVIAAYERTLGPDHPRVASVRRELARQQAPRTAR